MRFNTSLFLTFAIAFAKLKDYEIGRFRLYVPVLNKFSDPITAKFKGHLSADASKRELIFRIQDDGSVKELRRQGYLNINGDGKIVLTKTPQRGFALDEEDSYLTYMNEDIFQLCEDLSIGFKSNCTGPISSFFFYEGASAQDVFEELQHH